MVTPLVPKDEVQTHESSRFVQHAFQGSPPMFLTAFFSGKPISQEEAEELKRLIEAHKAD